MTERLARNGTWLVEGVTDGQQAAFPAADTVVLPPLEHKDAVSWLSAATANPLDVLRQLR